MATINAIIDFLNKLAWGVPAQMPYMVILLVGTGIFITIYLGFPQFLRLKHAIDVTRGKYDNPADAGDITHFQALSTALSATIGIGNISGVAIAIHYGGPGALFWMWITGLFGTSLKYTECTLSMKYRKINPGAQLEMAGCHICHGHGNQRAGARQLDSGIHGRRPAACRFQYPGLDHRPGAGPAGGRSDYRGYPSYSQSNPHFGPGHDHPVLRWRHADIDYPCRQTSRNIFDDFQICLLPSGDDRRLCRITFYADFDLGFQARPVLQ
jgi:hypothetical protein